MSIWKRVRTLEGTVGHLEKMLEIYYQCLRDSENSVIELKGQLERHGFPDERKHDTRGNRVERRRRRYA